MNKPTAFPEISAAQQAFNAGWVSAFDYTDQPYPSPDVLAQAYARYVAHVLASSLAPDAGAAKGSQS